MAEAPAVEADFCKDANLRTLPGQRGFKTPGLD
jgi:hypothetical protein